MLPWSIHHPLVPGLLLRIMLLFKLNGYCPDYILEYSWRHSPHILPLNTVRLSAVPSPCPPQQAALPYVVLPGSDRAVDGQQCISPVVGGVGLSQ